MSSCAIMQPTYLPWSGYFYLASKVDTFVFLDDVQFERRSWQSRNRILSNGQEHILSVPVKHSPQDTIISKIELSKNLPWRKKHLRSLQIAYPSIWRNTNISEPLIAEFEKSHQTLADLNIGLINMFFSWFGINCRTFRASELSCNGNRSKHLSEICSAIHADTYYSPIGSRAYLEEDKFQQSTGIALKYCNYIPTSYSQGKNIDFVSHLSVIDVVGHCGLAFTNDYIRKESTNANQD